MTGYAKIVANESGNAELHIIETSKVPDLQELQDVVGGLIEPLFTIPAPGGFAGRFMTGYVNEEGLCLDLPHVGYVEDENSGQYPFFGDMAITALDDNTGETRLLNDMEIGWIRSSFGHSGRLAFLRLANVRAK